ncbi:hypothetical protein CHU92_07210 [Flavobacterium cyanobacteriorum]|uniref:VOC domain-containing protein n=1 Tax=Flavobacterium cyanobacteriorum TaxID=2022802 RepID=A0A255Z916_9FLAO|nr:VOC family protein [Flavobacterium cyanobacteriorum]OYQ37946.1 hypothetical protein CHU92_07210 [Flavobacterium cyanobacteriorum]
MKVINIDHFVLTISDIEATLAFYCDILGMEKEEFGEHRIALKFGNQKINLHLKGYEVLPNALHAAPGTADICFIVDTPLAMVQELLKVKGYLNSSEICSRTGAKGAVESIYLRDPDGNLIELSNYL